MSWNGFLDPTSHYSSTTVLIARLLFAERNTNTKASTMNNSITQQECRPVSDEELNTISGGMMETVFWSGDSLVMISADGNHYEVETLTSTLCQTTIGRVGR